MKRVVRGACKSVLGSLITYYFLNEMLLSSKYETTTASIIVDDFNVVENWTWYDIEMKQQNSLLPHTSNLHIFPRPELHFYQSEFQAQNDKSIIIFNRNRKTGSSLLYSMLWKLNRSNNFSIANRPRCDITVPYSLAISEEQQICDVLKERMKVGRKLIWTKHVFYINCSNYSGINPTWINFVRNPVDRFTSLFHHLRRSRRNWNHGRPPEEWFEKNMSRCIIESDPECCFDNGAYREQQLSYFCGNALDCRQVGNTKALQVAKQNLEHRFAFVGITEKMIRSLKLLEVVLPQFFTGLSSIYEHLQRPRKNQNNHPTLTNEARKTLSKHMSFDVDFYEFARSHFQRMITKYRI